MRLSIIDLRAGGDAIFEAIIRRNSMIDRRP
jgi:hypothetical protein